MPGWILVSLFLALAGVVSLLVGQSPVVTFVLLVGALLSAIAGAILRPDRPGGRRLR